MPIGDRSRHTPKLNPAIGGLAARYKAKSPAGNLLGANRARELESSHAGHE